MGILDKLIDDVESIFNKKIAQRKADGEEVTDDGFKRALSKVNIMRSCQKKSEITIEQVEKFRKAMQDERDIFGNQQLHNLCEDKEYMAKMDALPLEPWGGQELALEEFEGIIRNKLEN